jgi:hypothetical protein
LERLANQQPFPLQVVVAERLGTHDPLRDEAVRAPTALLDQA